MGALHEGHLALVEQARKDYGKVVCSIFVNPLQFNDPKDLERYPRRLDADRSLLEEVGCDAVFAPQGDSLFNGFTPATYDLGGLDGHWEGPSRPGHFQGVVNVVERLFFHVRPDAAYFGEKDRQQLAILRHVAIKLRWPETIVAFPTIRASDGLALSSRNLRLDPNERVQAAALYRALVAADSELKVGTAASSKAAGLAVMHAAGVDAEYFGLADPNDLRPLDEIWSGSEAVLLVAARVGPVRLIDNLTATRKRTN